MSRSSESSSRASPSTETHNQRMYRRLRERRPIGVIVWQGPSLLDGKPIVVLATGLQRSANRKIGGMVQFWILRSDLDPYSALMNGSDASICGDCKFRPQGQYRTNRTCYVQVWPYAVTIWRAFMRGSYKPLCDFKENPFAGRFLRLGAYGDPAAVPTYVWHHVLEEAAGWTAYTHSWSSCDPELKKIAMASVDSPEELKDAEAKGWRCFRTRFHTESLMSNEIVCPASNEGGHKLTCAECGLCKGTALGGRHIAIFAHGAGAANYITRRSQAAQLHLPLVT